MRVRISMWRMEATLGLRWKTKRKKVLHLKVKY